jgi:hypothetical protein
MLNADYRYWLIYHTYGNRESDITDINGNCFNDGTSREVEEFPILTSVQVYTGTSGTPV